MEKKNCPVCGASIPSLAGYCPECGASLRKMEPRPRKEQDPLDIDAEETADVREERRAESARRRREDYRRRDEEEDYEMGSRGSGSRALMPLFIVLCIILVALIGVVAAQILRRSPVSQTTPAVETTTPAVETTTTTAAPTTEETTTPAETSTAAASLESSTSEESESAAAETTGSEAYSDAGDPEGNDEDSSETAAATAAPTTAAPTTAAPTTVAPTYSTEDALDMVTTDAVNLRTGPGTEYSVVMVIPEDAKIKVIDNSETWYLVDYRGNQGYIYGDYALTAKEKAKRESEQESRRQASKEAAKETTKSSGGGSDDSSILPGSSSRYLDESDIDDLGKSDLRLARNEIYARHGYIFSDSSLQKYFEKKSWYSAKTSDAGSIESKLNKYENANLKLIYNYESEQGYR